MENQIKVITSASFTERDIATIAVAVSGMGYLISNDTIHAEDMEMSTEELGKYMLCLNQVMDKLEILQKEMKRERENRKGHPADDGASGD